MLPFRLRRRIPVRLRQYWKLLATCVAFVVTCAVVFSTVRVTPLVTSASNAGVDPVTQNIAGTTALFDATVAHDIALTFRDEDYQRMLDEFWTEGEKDFLEADITIDGTHIPSVGIRLKGNSTLAGLSRNGQARPGGFGPRPLGNGQQKAPNGDILDGFPGGDPAGPPNRRIEVNGGGPGGPGGFARASLKAEEPETLPWLIRFDEFVEGRRYQGHREIAMRVAGMGGGSAVLNEAVSLDVLAAAGQTTQRYAYAGFTVNDRPTTARLVVEHPGETFAATLGGSGVLYKSLATGHFTDQGDDPIDYADDFKQITMKGSQDLQPVINLIRWATTSSDADFDAHLADHLDVDAFARYVAVQNLLLNFDDMAGPGRNYYLWYDLGTRKFTVIGWDHNLTFTGSANQGANDNTGRGGRFGPPPGEEPPAGFQPPGGGIRMDGHKLKERFVASAAFQATYEKAYRELYQKIYASGAAQTSLTTIARVLSTVDGYDAQQTSADVNRLRAIIKQRTEYLATDQLITGR
jgi:spore coat protein CotH